MIFQLELNGVEVDVSCPDTGLTKIIVRDILESATYPIYRFMHDIESIVDIGAHVGAFSARMACTFPEAVIRAYEPNPEVFSYLKTNLNLPGRVIYLHPVGVGDRTGTATLGLYEDSVLTSEFPVPNKQLLGQIEVQIMDAFDLPGRIDILKIDTEGNEMPILRRLGQRLFDIPYIYLEFHSQADRLEIDKMLLPTHNLHSAKIIHSGCGEVFYLKHGWGAM